MISDYESNDELFNKPPAIFHLMFPEPVNLEDGETIKNEWHVNNTVTSTIIKKDGSIRVTYRGKINGKIVELKEIK